ncbi:hypothetical protein [Sphingomonas sp.]|uniref:hypothetical protein n=1 Tax=Sphingomonas sp. TaxID=28214 RepID=UPI001D2AA4D9|nr:hypothetical protein [Sphingomonas sp.]MBX9797524.1 hypothetical protein [Sphingomonas sp.]
MDALMAALVAALAAQLSDRVGLGAAAIAGRTGRAGAVILGTALALAIANALAAGAAAVIAPLLTPNARALFLALALGSAALGGIGAAKPPREGGGRLGPFTAALVSGLALGLGDRSQFLAGAIGVRSGAGIFAATGATIGGTVAVAALVLAEPGLRRVLAGPMVRLPLAALFALAAIAAALSAFRLI